MQVGEVGLQPAAAVVVTDVRAGECVEGADVGGLRHLEHRHRQRRHQRLVEVQDVEVFLLHDRRDLIGQVKAERDPRHRIVDGDGDRAADAIEASGVEIDGH